MEDYTPQEIRLAREIAERIGDLDSITYHLQNTRRFKEEFLRRKLAKVLATPQDKIRTSRAALYVHLINQAIKYGDSGH